LLAYSPETEWFALDETLNLFDEQVQGRRESLAEVVMVESAWLVSVREMRRETHHRFI
jgi:hypothetical protein